MLYCKDKPVGIVRLPLGVLVQRKTTAAWYPLLPIDLPSHHHFTDSSASMLSNTASPAASSSPSPDWGSPRSALGLGASLAAGPTAQRAVSRGAEVGSLPHILIDYHYAPNNLAGAATSGPMSGRRSTSGLASRRPPSTSSPPLSPKTR